MDATPLLENMTKEVERQQEALLAEARETATKLIAEARENARCRREEAISQLREELEAQTAHMRERAEMRAKAARMNIKDTVTDELLNAVRADLRALAQEETRFPKLLFKLLEELLLSKVGKDWRQSGRLELLVKAPGAHVDAVHNWLAEQGVTDVQVDALPGLTDGVALEDAEHTYRVSNTLHDRMEKQEKTLRGYAMQQLFKGQPGATHGEEGSQ